MQNEMIVEKHEQVWMKCLSIFKDNLPESAYKTWFEPIKPLALLDGVLTIQVPSAYFYEFLEEKFADIIGKTLFRVIGEGAMLEYKVVMDRGNRPDEGKSVVYPGRNIPVQQPVDKTQHADNIIRNPFAYIGSMPLNINPRLNTNNSYANFIEGKCNKVAYAAGKSIAAAPGTTPFNPLFVYGESGLGKTHLVHAIGLEVKERFPDKNVLYVSANQFVMQYTQSIVNKTHNDFLNFYQIIDVLIIDDIHELSGKTGTQNTFFHIFNHLHQNNKQLIMTSDKPPFQLEGVEQRLLSRFKWGLSSELEMPDYVTRKDILTKKAYREGLDIKPEVIDYLAENISGNVRELEGALISLVAQSAFMSGNKEITLDMAGDIVSKLVKTSNRTISIEKIEEVVCQHYNITKDVLLSKSRKREVVVARQMAMYLAKAHTKNSLQIIGKRIGDRDHATVLHACKAINNLMETDKNFRENLKEVELKLKF